MLLRALVYCFVRWYTASCISYEIVTALYHDSFKDSRVYQGDILIQATIQHYSALITQATLCSGCVLSCGRLRDFAKSYQFIIFGIAFRNRLRISEGAFHIGNSSMCYVLLYCILHKLRSDLHRQQSTIV